MKKRQHVGLGWNDFLTRRACANVTLQCSMVLFRFVSIIGSHNSGAGMLGEADGWFSDFQDGRISSQSLAPKPCLNVAHDRFAGNAVLEFDSMVDEIRSSLRSSCARAWHRL